MFLILQLPSVALRLILDTFDIQDLIFLSFCSSRTCLIVKMTRSKPTGLRLHANCVDAKISVWIEKRLTWSFGAVKQDHPCLTSKGTVKIRGVTVSIGEVYSSKTYLNYMATFWKDPIIGYRAIMEYLRDVFRVNIHRVYFDRDTFWMMDWIREHQNVVQKAQSHGESLNSEEFDKVLKTCKAKELLLHSSPEDDFKYTGGLEGRERIYIAYGKWLTLENLLEINVPDIYVGYSQLTDNDVNQLLKKWLAGGLPKLKFLRLNLTQRRAEDILDGLNVEEKPGRTYRRHGWTYEFNDNKELQRCDGATASIIVTPYSFTFALWPDSSA